MHIDVQIAWCAQHPVQVFREPHALCTVQKLRVHLLLVIFRNIIVLKGANFAEKCLNEFKDRMGYR